MTSHSSASVPDRRRATAFALLAVLGVNLILHWAMLDNGLQGDDFQLVVANRDLDVAAMWRFLVWADYGERAWVYWRPAWVATFAFLHDWFGADPVGYQAFALSAHTLQVAVVFLVARSLARSDLAAAVGALWFGLHPSHAEAVYWVAAATNVIPAAILLLTGAWLLQRYLQTSRVTLLVLAVSVAVVSLAWKEAAYGFPLLVTASVACVRSGPAGRRQRFELSAAACLSSAFVAAHYLFRNKTSGVGGSLVDMAGVAVGSIAGVVRKLFIIGLPVGDGVLVGSVVAIWLAALWMVSRPMRFWLFAAAAGMLPYALLSSGSRFAYFFDGPAAVVLAGALAFVRHWPGWAGALVFVAAATPLWWATDALSRVRIAFGAEASLATDVLEALASDGLLERPVLRVDRVPPCLVNGFESAIRLRFDKKVVVHSFEAVPRPPFVVHIDLGGLAFGADQHVLRFDPANRRYVLADPSSLFGSLVPVPLFSLAAQYRLVEPGKWLQVMASGEADPAVVPMLEEAPSPPPDPAAVGSIRDIRTDVRNMGMTVECSGAMLLVVSFPVSARFSEPGGFWVDGVRVRAVTANGIFHCVTIPPGTHDVRMLPVID